MEQCGRAPNYIHESVSYLYCSELWLASQEETLDRLTRYFELQVAGCELRLKITNYDLEFINFSHLFILLLLPYYWIKLNCSVGVGNPDMPILNSALPFHCSFYH